MAPIEATQERRDPRDLSQYHGIRKVGQFLYLCFRTVDIVEAPGGGGIPTTAEDFTPEMRAKQKAVAEALSKIPLEV